MQRQITTEQIVDAGLEQLRHSLYVSMPGAVVAYYPQDQTADIQPMINDVRWNTVTDAIVFEPWSVIHRVPIMWPRMGGMVIAGFLQANDQVVLQAFDLDPGPWRKQGRSQSPVNPADVSRLAGKYWRANPTDLTGPIASAPQSQGLVIGHDGQVAQIVFTPGNIQVGASGCAVALAGGGPAVGRVGDAVQVSVTPAEVLGAMGTLVANLVTGVCAVSVPGSPRTASGTITAGSAHVTSG